jgi:hypothetical protein
VCWYSREYAAGDGGACDEFAGLPKLRDAEARQDCGDLRDERIVGGDGHQRALFIQRCLSLRELRRLEGAVQADSNAYDSLLYVVRCAYV